MDLSGFEGERPADYLTRLAASTHGQARMPQVDVCVGDIHALGLRDASVEPDWDMLVVDYPGLPTARAYTRYITEQVIRNPAIGRQLARLATGAGFRVEKVMPLTAVFRDVQAADKVFGFRRVTERAVGAGYLTQQAAGEWLGYLATEPFFAAATLFVVTAVAA